MRIAERSEQPLSILQTEFYRECFVPEGKEIAVRFVKEHHPQITQITQKRKGMKNNEGVM